MLQDFLCQLTGRANRDGTVYFNTENILATIAYFVLGWVMASIIMNIILKKHGAELLSIKPNLKAFENLVGTGSEYVVHERSDTIHVDNVSDVGEIG